MRRRRPSTCCCWSVCLVGSAGSPNAKIERPWKPSAVEGLLDKRLKQAAVAVWIEDEPCRCRCIIHRIRIQTPQISATRVATRSRCGWMASAIQDRLYKTEEELPKGVLRELKNYILKRSGGGWETLRLEDALASL